MTSARSTNALELTWCILRSECPEDVALTFLETTREFLPGAEPKTFGTTETSTGGIADPQAGDDAFVALWESNDRFHWRPEKPFSYGTVNGLGALDNASERKAQNTLEPAIVGSIELIVDAVFLDEPTNIDHLRTYFATLANRTASFFATVGVGRNAIWKSRDLHAAQSNPAIVLQGSFYGLPIGDIWLLFVDDRYHDLLKGELNLVPTSGGYLFEVEDAWRGFERTGRDSLLGRVPTELLYQTKALGKVGRTAIRRGVGLIDAEIIPRDFSTTNAWYRAFAWTVEPLDLDELAEALDVIDGASIIRRDEDQLECRIESWTLRFRGSKGVDAVGSSALRGFFNAGTPEPQGGTLASSVDEYREIWEISGSKDPQMERFNTWLAGIEAACRQHEATIWFDVGPLD